MCQLTCSGRLAHMDAFLRVIEVTLDSSCGGLITVRADIAARVNAPHLNTNEASKDEQGGGTVVPPAWSWSTAARVHTRAVTHMERQSTGTDAHERNVTWTQFADLLLPYTQNVSSVIHTPLKWKIWQQRNILWRGTAKPRLWGAKGKNGKKENWIKEILQ